MKNEKESALVSSITTMETHRPDTNEHKQVSHDLEQLPLKKEAEVPMSLPSSQLSLSKRDEKNRKDRFQNKKGLPDLETQQVSSTKVAEPTKEVVRPGAVAMRGAQQDSRTAFDDDDADGDDDYETQLQVSSPHFIPAEEVQTLEHGGNATISNIIAEQVRQAVLQDTVQAEVMQVNDASTTEIGQKRKITQRDPGQVWWKRFLCFGLTAVFAAVFLYVVVLILRHHHSTSHNDGTTQTNVTGIRNRTRPESSGQSEQDPSCIYCVQNVTSDLPKNATLNITEILMAASNHSILLDSLDRTGVKLNLNNATLFAPTNEAFHALPLVHSFYFDKDTNDWIYHLVRLLQFHVVTEPLNISQIFRHEELSTLLGLNVTVNRTGMTVADGAKLVVTDVRASNGYIHVPDRVFLTDDIRKTLLDLTNTFSNGSEFSIFGKMIAFVGIDSILQGLSRTGLTIFVPTNNAFEARGSKFIEELTSAGNENKTRDIVLYHVLARNAYQGVIHQVLNENHITALFPFTYSRLSVWISMDPTTSALFMNSAPIQEHGEVYAQNGLMQAIDEVLIPPSVEDLLVITTNVTMRYSFATFLSVVHGAAKLGSLFSSGDDVLTVFAPLDVAFESSSTNPLGRWLEPGWLIHLQSIVRFHCVAGKVQNINFSPGNYTFTTLSGFNTSFQVKDADPDSQDIIFSNGSKAKLKNLVGTNGIVHGIDGVLLPPWTGNDMIETLTQKQVFSTFLRLAALSNVTIGDGGGPFTVLAPNNTAFAALGSTLTAASANITLIRQIISRHIFSRNLYSSQLNHSVVSESNNTFQVDLVNNQTFVGGALLLETDVLCSNGLVHVIDRVLT